MIKAVIFDFFGVLSLRGSESFRKTHFKDDKEKFSKAQELNDEYNRGIIGYDDFIHGLAKLGEVAREEVLEFTENYQPNSELLDYIKTELKPNYKIGIISNAGEDWVLKILGKESEDLFDDIVLSYKVGLIKPEPAIYETSACNLGVNEEECVFIDDILRYCQGAEQVGMNSIWYQDFDSFKADMDRLLAAGPDN
ncbi:MAG TPA: HAD-IA family hydrolase [Candidatus Saccharimonadales bacterium]|nr:HAD-IA family hydrolase [Candidatus Saccharimonadales bacterium]